MNSRSYLEKCKTIILENLRFLDAAPSVQFQYVPPDIAIREAEAEVSAKHTIAKIRVVSDTSCNVHSLVCKCTSQCASFVS
jgi:hypothetical protein